MKYVDCELLTPAQEARRALDTLVARRAAAYYVSEVGGIGIDAMLSNLEEASQRMPTPWTVYGGSRLRVGWVTATDRERYEEVRLAHASAARDLNEWAHRQVEARAGAEVERDEAVHERDEARDLAADLYERLMTCQAEAQDSVEAQAEIERLRAEVERLRSQVWRLTQQSRQDDA